MTGSHSRLQHRQYIRSYTGMAFGSSNTKLWKLVFITIIFVKVQATTSSSQTLNLVVPGLDENDRSNVINVRCISNDTTRDCMFCFIGQTDCYPEVSSTEVTADFTLVVEGRTESTVYCKCIGHNNVALESDGVAIAG